LTNFETTSSTAVSRASPAGTHRSHTVCHRLPTQRQAVNILNTVGCYQVHSQNRCPQFAIQATHAISPHVVLEVRRHLSHVGRRVVSRRVPKNCEKRLFVIRVVSRRVRKTAKSDCSSSASFRDAFAKLRKATVRHPRRFETRSQNCEKLRFVISVTTVLGQQLGSRWTEFHYIWYLSIFLKPVPKIQVSLKSDKNDSHFTLRPTDISDRISPNSS
jgi:hypothetical protein